METTASLVERARATTRPFQDLYPYEPHFLEVSGSALHYIDEGPRGNGAMLCVHGNPTWSFYWRAVARAFRSETRVVVPDHLGMGLSDRVGGGVRLAEHVDALIALVESLDLRDVTLVVHDWGGAIGFGAALALRDRITRFVVTNCAAFPSGMMPKRIAACRIPLFGRIAVQQGNAFARAATRMTTVRPLSGEVKRALLAPYASPRDREQVWRFVADIPMSDSHPSWKTLCGIADGLESLRGLPMELVWGMHDWCFRPEFLARWQQYFPDAGVRRLDDAGHYVCEDAPAALIDAIADVRRRPVTPGVAT
ncbi:MAG: alpha/beta fold hydrolase [Planctomycetota bacterium]